MVSVFAGFHDLLSMKNMYVHRLVLVVTTIVLGVASSAMAIEEAAYSVVVQEGNLEIRDYAPQLLAETRVDGSMEDAGNRAFRVLFRYISGENQPQEKIAMTAPVSQQRDGEKIAMTAPVGQERDGDDWLVSFMMPASYTMATLPAPTDSRVVLREVPARRVAAIRYSGFWSEKNYERNKETLVAWIQEQGLRVSGTPVWARYNSPFMPWFMRRNEILMPVE